MSSRIRHRVSRLQSCRSVHNRGVLSPLTGVAARRWLYVGIIGLPFGVGCMRFGYEPLDDEASDGAAGEAPLGSNAASTGTGGTLASGGSSSTSTSSAASGGGGSNGAGAQGSSASTGGASGTGGTAGGTGTGGSGGSTGTGGTTAGNGSGGTSGGGSGGTAANVGGSGGTASTSSGGSSGTSDAACAATGTETMVLTFDSDIAGFVLASQSSAATLTHTSAVGDPDLGAVEVSTGQNQNVIVAHPEASAVDMSGRTLSVSVFVEPGFDVDAWVFVQTSTNYFWTDAQYLAVPTGTWTCLSLDLDNPENPHAQYDATDVVQWGIRFSASGGFQVYFDQFAY